MHDYTITITDDKGEYTGRLAQWVMAIYRAMSEEQQAVVRADLLRMASRDGDPQP